MEINNSRTKLREQARGSVTKAASPSKATSKQVFKILNETLRSPNGSEVDRISKLNPSESNKFDRVPKAFSPGPSNELDAKKKPSLQSHIIPTPSTAFDYSGVNLGEAFSTVTKTKGKTSILHQDKLADINNNNYSRMDVPHSQSTIPPSMKDCHLSNVLRSARRSLEQLREVREGLSNLVAEDEHLSKGIKKSNPGPELLQLSQVAEILTILSREAFVPAHRLNQTTIALYNAEDYLRYPTDIRTFDIAATGRIKLPDPSFNIATVEKLRSVNDRATDFYNKFDAKGTLAHELHEILFTLLRSLQDFYACTMGIQEVFKVLLYTNQKEKQHLQQFLLSLPSMERSDMLTEVQDLRRLIDELVIFLEKLSWGSFVVYRLASGKSVNSSPRETPSGTPRLTHMNSYPAYNSLQKGSKTSKTKVDKKRSTVAEDKVEDGTERKGSKVKVKGKEVSETSVAVKKVKGKKSSKSRSKSKKEKGSKSRQSIASAASGSNMA